MGRLKTSRPPFHSFPTKAINAPSPSSRQNPHSKHFTPGGDIKGEALALQTCRHRQYMSLSFTHLRQNSSLQNARFLLQTCLLCKVAPPSRHCLALRARRVEEWRGGVGAALLVAGPFGCRCPSSSPCSVSTPRSSNRTCRFAASGSRTRVTHAFASRGG